MRLRLFLSLTFVCSIAFAQTSSLDPIAVAKQIAAKAEAAREYSFEGELTIDGQVGTNPARLLSKATVKIAVAPDGKYMLRLAPVDKDEYWLVSNGQKNWAYVPKLKQYSEEEAGMRTGDSEGAEGSDEERDLAETWVHMLMPQLARMAKTAQGVDIGPELAEIRYEKKKQKWPVVRILSRPEPDGTRNLTEIAVDRDSTKIGRVAWTSMTPKDGERTKVRMTIDFTTVQMGGPLGPDIFEFQPPKNAKLVDAVPIPGQTGSLLLNRPAPDFDLKTLEGDKIRLADLRGKPVLLVFWASWCGPCRREMPTVIKLHEEFKGKGLTVLGVNDEGKGTARRFAEKNGVSFTILDDSGYKAHRLYKVNSIPKMFLIDRDGKVVRYLSGGKEEQVLRAALKSVGL